MRARSHGGVVLGLAVLAAGAAARADDLTVVSLEHGAWPATVTALQRDLHSEGRLIHVEARDAHRRALPCGTYTLSFDEAGRQAFEVRECDPQSSLTELRLANRGALFLHDDVVPRPAAVALTAASVPTELVCRATVFPSLEDMEHGTRVYLTAPRFSLRVLLAGVEVVARPDGWELRGGSHPATVEYDVVDTARNRIVLHAQAQLACAAQPVAAGAGAEAGAEAGAGGGGAGSGSGVCGAVDLVPGVAVRGSTTGRADSGHASCGGGAYGPDAVYRLTVPYRADVALRLESEFDGVLYLRRDCGAQASELWCNDDGPDATHSQIVTTLDVGTYFVFVDGYGSSVSQRVRAGNYQLLATVEPAGAGRLVYATVPPVATSPPATNPAATNPAATSVPADPVPVAGSLQSGVAVHGSTADQASHYQGACGSGRSPDQVWRLVVRERSRLNLQLSSTFDGVLVVRRTLEGHEDDVPCDDDAGDARHSEITETVDPGVYFVIVDGYGDGNRGEYDLTATLRRP